MRMYVLYISLFMLLLSCTDSINGNSSGTTKQKSNTSGQAFEVLGDKVDKVDMVNGLQQWTVYKNDVLIEEGEVLNNQKNGSWLEFYNNGFIKTNTTYHKGKKNGAYLLLNLRGALQERHYYKNDLLDGKKIKYTLGKVVLVEEYEKGKLNGKRILFYEDGTIQEEGNFVNAKRHGNQKWYNQKGEISIEYEYENGEKVEE